MNILLLKKKGLTQRQIAKLGISRNTVKKYIDNQGSLINRDLPNNADSFYMN